MSSVLWPTINFDYNPPLCSGDISTVVMSDIGLHPLVLCSIVPNPFSCTIVGSLVM